VLPPARGPTDFRFSIVPVRAGRRRADADRGPEPDHVHRLVRARGAGRRARTWPGRSATVRSESLRSLRPNGAG